MKLITTDIEIGRLLDLVEAGWIIEDDLPIMIQLKLMAVKAARAYNGRLS